MFFGRSSFLVCLSNTQRRAVLCICRRCHHNSILRIMITAFLLLEASYYPRLPEVRTVERNVKIYDGHQNNISCSKSINLLLLCISFESTGIIILCYPKWKKHWQDRSSRGLLRINLNLTSTSTSRVSLPKRMSRAQTHPASDVAKPTKGAYH